MFCCIICNYSTDRKYCYDRHYNSNKHLKLEDLNKKKIEENKIDNNSELTKKFNCKKCCKSYKTEKSFISHEIKCIGIDILTCPKCMKTFKHQSSKSKHITAKKCKAKSIITYNNPDIPNNPSNNPNNFTNNITNNIITNNINNITNNVTNNYFIINPYGSERIDYLTTDEMIKIFRIAPPSSIIPNYIEAKHFNKDFPENNNIKYKNKTCFTYIDNTWKITNIDLLSNELLVKNSNEINHKFNSDKNKIDNEYKNDDLLEQIQAHFNYLDLFINPKLYKVIKTKIKDLIRTKN